jgi:hypothetical protein
MPREIIQDICGRELTAQNALLRSIAANLRRLTEAASDLVPRPAAASGEGSAESAAW